MLNYQEDMQYDAVICLGNSFGYFGYDKMILFSKVLAQAVKPGGFLLVNTSSLAESMLPQQYVQNWMQVGDLYFLMSHQYDSLLGALKTDMQFIKGDDIEKKTAYHFTYTLSEVLRIFGLVGFHLERICGDLEGNSFKLGDRQAYILLGKY